MRKIYITYSIQFVLSHPQVNYFPQHTVLNETQSGFFLEGRGMMFHPYVYNTQGTTTIS